MFWFHITLPIRGIVFGEQHLSTHIGVGLSDHERGYECGREAAHEARATLRGDTISLALLFTSHPEPAQVLRGVNETFPKVSLIGATSAGQYSHKGYVEQGAGVMLIQSEQIQFHPTAYQRRLFGGRKLLGKLYGTSKDGLGSAYNHRTLFLFPDDRSMNLDGVVDRAMTETGMLYDILGGPGPTTDAPPRPPAVFYNNRVFQAGLSGAEILSQTPLGLAFTNGWTPLSGPYRVTHADERRVIKIDGRPAWEVYEDFLHEHRVSYTDEKTLKNVLLHHPIGICESGDCKVSVLMGFDETGALITTSPPPVGRLIHILSTQTDAMVTAAKRAVQEALQQVSSQPKAGALFIDCMSTGWVLDEAYSQQRDAVQQCIGDAPFLGFRSHGVLVRLQGQIAGHYECSVATCVLPG